MARKGVCLQITHIPGNLSDHPGRDFTPSASDILYKLALRGRQAGRQASCLLFIGEGKKKPEDY